MTQRRNARCRMEGSAGVFVRFMWSISAVMLVASTACTRSPAAIGPAASRAVSGAERRVIEQTILALEDRWAQVDVTNDRTVFDTIIAPDFHSTSSRTGRRRGRAEWIAEWEYEGVTSARQVDPAVDVYSADVAVYSGIDETRGRSGNGSEWVHQDICTDTWLRRGGRWEVVAAHCSRIK